MIPAVDHAHENKEVTPENAKREIPKMRQQDQNERTSMK